MLGYGYSMLRAQAAEVVGGSFDVGLLVCT